MNRIYLDHAATTPPHPAAVGAMREALTIEWANPSSLHTEGRAARQLRERAREQVAALLEAKLSEVFFTASGTEADQWALLGVAELFRESKGRLITSNIEHSAVRNTADILAQRGWEVCWLFPDRAGRYALDELRKLMGSETRLVSLMYCNNELGTIQDIQSLCELAHQAGALFHTDAVQALGKLPSPVPMGVDLASVSSHKINGPKGQGALWVRSGLDYPSWISKGSQERGKHPGTEGMPAIAGFGGQRRYFA